MQEPTSENYLLKFGRIHLRGREVLLTLTKSIWSAVGPIPKWNVELKLHEAGVMLEPAFS